MATEKPPVAYVGKTIKGRLQLRLKNQITGGDDAFALPAANEIEVILPGKISLLKSDGKVTVIDAAASTIDFEAEPTDTTGAEVGVGAIDVIVTDTATDEETAFEGLKSIEIRKLANE